MKKLKQFEISKQLLLSSTSIGANIREAQRGVSKKDFINKLGIALKEAEETKFWLEIINNKIFEVDKNLTELCDELI